MAGANPNIMPGTQSDPLAQLRDIHLPGSIEVWPPPPGSIGVWPPAPGWWILAALCLVAVVLALRWLWTRWQANKYRREARAQLDAILLSWESHGDTAQYLREYQLLLKRTALTRYSRETVASLTGEAWVDFLDRSSSSHEFTMGEGQKLIDGNYINTSSINTSSEQPIADVHKLHLLALDWIRNHGDLAVPEAAA
jgi:hypothetical protein